MAEEKVLQTRLLLRNDTAAKWIEFNPVLKKGEIGIEIDTNKYKFGDGVKHWNELDYVSKALETEIDKLKEKDKAIDQTISNLETAYKDADTEINNKITAMDGAYKAADTALDTRLKKAEESLKDVTNVMDFRGAVDTKPATIEGYQKGDVIVVTKGDDAGKEFVCDGTTWVEFGNSSAEQAAIAALQAKDAEHDAAIATKAADTEFKALKGVVEHETTGLAATKAIADANKAAIENADSGLAKAHEKADKNAQDITALTSGKENVGVAQSIVDGINSEITGTPAVDSTITALEQTKGKVTATVEKIQIAQSQVTGLPAALESKVDKDPNARLMTNDEGASLAELVSLKPAEAGAQVNKIETINTGDGALSIANKAVSIPTAMANTLGLVKGSTAENGIEVNNGLMSVHSLNVNKLVQTAGEELILDGGNAKSASLNK